MTRRELHELYRDELRRLYQVSEVDVMSWRGDAHGQCIASLRPVAVVVDGPDGVIAFDTGGRRLGLDDLRRDCAALDAVLDERSSRADEYRD